MLLKLRLLLHQDVVPRAARSGEQAADNAAKVSRELCKLIDEGYDIVALTASCGLMLKFEWALISNGC